MPEARSESPGIRRWIVVGGFLFGAAAAVRMAEPPLPDEPRGNLQRTSRAVYRYSVIPGGAYDRTEITAALARDPVVATHYQRFDVRRAKPVRARRDLALYVSYRRSSNVYWTSARVRIPAGELLLSDGVEFARARCGNRLSRQPRMPTGFPEPTPSELESSLSLADGVDLLAGQTTSGHSTAPPASSRTAEPARPIPFPGATPPNPWPAPHDFLFAPPVGEPASPGAPVHSSEPPFFPGHLAVGSGWPAWGSASPKPGPEEWPPAQIANSPADGGGAAPGGPLIEDQPPGLVVDPPPSPSLPPAPPLDVPEPASKLLVLLVLGAIVGGRKLLG